MPKLEVFIWPQRVLRIQVKWLEKKHTRKALPIDRLPSSSIMPSKITSLDHKLKLYYVSARSLGPKDGAYVWDDTMKDTASVAVTMLTGCEFTKVPGSFRYDVVEKLEDCLTRQSNGNSSM